MRAFLCLLSIVLAGCAPQTAIVSQRDLVSQRAILKQAHAEIAWREPWARSAAIFIKQVPDSPARLTWRVSAGAFDLSDYPRYRGIHLVPGTERELKFTRSGCLVAYIDRGSYCLTAAAEGAPVFPAK
ncbi:MAG: hypothetical protein WED15_01990 [Akkermansiaceae bacterium]